MFQKFLGEELRALRHRRGLTLTQLNAQLSSPLTAPTLRRYELAYKGSALRVDTLLDLSLALGAQPEHLLASVRRRMAAESDTAKSTGSDIVRIDLIRASTDDRPEMATVRRWAETQLQQSPETRYAPVARAALTTMASLCGLSPADLLDRIAILLAPPPAHHVTTGIGARTIHTADHQPIRHPIRGSMTGEARIDLAREFRDSYLQGMSVSEIAHQAGRSESFVRRLIRKFYPEFIFRHTPVTAEEREKLAKKMAQLYLQEGKSTDEIGEMLGWSHATVHRYLVEFGTVMRPRGRFPTRPT